MAYPYEDDQEQPSAPEAGCTSPQEPAVSPSAGRPSRRPGWLRDISRRQREDWTVRMVMAAGAIMMVEVLVKTWAASR